jgi:hypothetical protein
MDVQARIRGAIDAAIAGVATTQHGLITREQLFGLGLGAARSNIGYAPAAST